MEKKRQRTMWLMVGLLLAMYALALTSLHRKSPTFDEQGFLTRGVAYLRGEHRQLRVGHPLGLNALNGLLLSMDNRVALPTDDPSWQGTNFHRPSELFMWEIGNDVERVMFLGRLPTIWLGLLLAAVAGRWAWEMTRKDLAGLLALLLITLDPNILAHTRLATTDLGLAAGALLVGYTLWRFWKEPSWPRVLLAGGAFGLLMNTKFTAGLFIPLLASVMVVAFVDRWLKLRRENASRRRIWQPALMIVVGFPAAAFLVLWASFGFQVGTLPDELPVMSQLGGTTWPASHYIEQLLDIGGRMQKSTPAFLLGEYSDNGWWYYFPVAFVLKTPLPLLILLTWAIARLVLCGVGRLRPNACLSMVDVAILLIPAAGYFAVALTTDINLGYRHLLPMLPLLAVFIAAMLSGLPATQRELRPRLGMAQGVLGILVIWLGLASLWIYPHFLSFFNVLAGGADGGWRALVDSNIDWGQDLAGLKEWMVENDAKEVWLSYFGEARPEYYGINYQGLDSFPPRLMNPAAKPFYPARPAPGTYAISATTLQGVHFQDHKQFAWFKAMEPVDKIGYSIFIYEVPADGEAIELFLGGLQLDEIDEAAFDLWASNDVTAHWFDPEQSLLTAEGDGVWLALAKDAAVHPQVAQELARWQLMSENEVYRLLRRPEDLENDPGVQAVFEGPAGRLTLNSVSGDWQEAVSGGVFGVKTTWTKHGPATPLTLFIHVIGEDDAIVSQWDGLGVPWEGWRDGDRLMQLHSLTVPENMQPGRYEVWLGVYEPESGQRWQVDGQDRLQVGHFVIDG